MKNKEEKNKHAKLLTIVHKITHRIISILELQKLLQSTVTDIQKHLGYYNVTLLLLNKETHELGRQAMAGAYTELAPLDYHQKVGEGLIGLSAKTGKSLLVNNVQKDVRYIAGFEKSVPTRSELCVPIKLEGEVIAVLDIQEPKVNAFTETDLKILETLGEQIAVAIKNAQWHEKLQKEIRERLQTEQVLRESLEEKELLLKEIHHRIKNNLTMISSIINMERNRVPGTETDRILSNIQNRIKAIGLIHQNLYKGKDIDRVSVKMYCEDLIRQIQFSFSSPSIQIEKSIDNMDLPIDLALPCGLLLAELLTNALKYAFPEKRTGKIFIQFKRISSTAKEPYLELRVKDNGVGLPKHVSWKNPESMGFRLIHALTQQLNGKLQIKSKTGTECCIRFPLNPWRTRTTPI